MLRLCNTIADSIKKISKTVFTFVAGYFYRCTSIFSLKWNINFLIDDGTI